MHDLVVHPPQRPGAVVERHVRLLHRRLQARGLELLAAERACEEAPVVLLALEQVAEVETIFGEALDAYGNAVNRSVVTAAQQLAVVNVSWLGETVASVVASDVTATVTVAGGVVFGKQAFGDVEHRLVEGDVDELALAGALLVEQGRGHRLGHEQARDLVGHQAGQDGGGHRVRLPGHGDGSRPRGWRGALPRMTRTSRSDFFSTVVLFFMGVVLAHGFRRLAPPY